MKAKWVKAAGLLVAGSLVFSAAYIDGKPGVKDTQEVMAESTDSQIHEVSAGVSSTLAEQMENYTKQGTDLASGVTDVMSDYLSVTAADMVSVSESDRDMTASGQEDETTNRGRKTGTGACRGSQCIWIHKSGNRTGRWQYQCP